VRELTTTDYERIHAQVNALQRVYMWGPAKLAYVAVLLTQIARTEPLWPTPEEPAWPIPDPPPTCAPLVRSAVPPALTPDQTWLLARAATAAAHGRVRLWNAEFGEIAELHPACPPSAGWAPCRGEGCPWCAWAVDPTPEKLPAFVMPPNPYLPPEQAEWVTAEIGGYRVSGPANQPGVRLFGGEPLW
jgi:hypothetical protein